MIVDSVLVHVCCAHCAAYTLDFWQKQGYRVEAFWYNPNIHPEEEYQLRMDATRRLLEGTGIPLKIYSDYQPSEYFDAVRGQSEERCKSCFRLRLGQTAAVALERGFTAFSSSLLISPHQQHENLLSIGNALAEIRGIRFLYSDLRRRYSDSRVMTKHRDLYRQEYCGCQYSKQERFSSE
ncbi:MAG: epoxyqueuosine reductase QueH [Dehalococcoidales bacterium]|jgi:predicted adenine nucleotide alpha hydrolase (AANH) superfamily ATPase|nr:epoxyqueuosine reductase QueH [Dehalococcoidales bacterium]MDX9986211.1 epoxyqueuosine reductase QueH [Dehalococcoidales bacterium]